MESFLTKKPIDAETLEEFILFFKYLVFVASAAKAPFKQKMLEETLTRIAKAGDVKNIERWCWWTPTQLSLLELAEKLTRVILIGGNGTGKTAILEAFATRIAKQEQEDVIFAIHTPKKNLVSSARPLLQLDLEVKFDKLKRVTVKTFDILEDIQVSNLANTTVCIDEIEMKNVKPDQLNQFQAKALWIVIRDTDTKGNPEKYLRKQFPNWTIVNLSYPLRNSKTISERIRNGVIFNALYTNQFNKSLKLVENMPLGPGPLIIQKSRGSYSARLKLAFREVGTDRPALIILNFLRMKPTIEEIKETEKSTSFKHLVHGNLLKGIEKKTAKVWIL